MCNYYINTKLKTIMGGICAPS
jgi:hypothetical protein